MEKRDYFIAAVGVDAYLISNPLEDNQNNAVTLEVFKDKLISHAAAWGEQVVGNWFFKHKDAPRVRGSNKIALAFGNWGTATELSFYVACLEEHFRGDYWFERIEVSQEALQEGWDIT